jgi:GntR family transcriptional regulator
MVDLLIIVILMTIGLSKATPGLLYQQVASLIRTSLNKQELVPGSRLPSIEEMARMYGVSIVTVRQAIVLLEEEGLVQRRHGRGTFVLENAKRGHWLQLQSSWESLVEMWGHSKPRPIRILDTVGMPILDEADGTAAPAYRYMRRVHAAEDMPYVVIDIYVDRQVYSRSPRRFDSEMVIVVLDSLGLIKSMKQRLTIGTADMETASLLDVPVNSAVGMVRRVITGHDGVVLYVGEAVYRGDLVRFEREIERP